MPCLAVSERCYLIEHLIAIDPQRRHVAYDDLKRICWLIGSPVSPHQSSANLSAHFRTFPLGGRHPSAHTSEATVRSSDHSGFVSATLSSLSQSSFDPSLSLPPSPPLPQPLARKRKRRE